MRSRNYIATPPGATIKIELILGVPAKFWNNLESMYREIISKTDEEE